MDPTLNSAVEEEQLQSQLKAWVQASIRSPPSRRAHPDGLASHPAHPACLLPLPDNCAAARTPVSRQVQSRWPALAPLCLPLCQLQKAPPWFSWFNLQLRDSVPSHQSSSYSPFPATAKMCGHVKATQKIGEVCRAVGLCLTCIQPLRDVIESRQPPANGATKATKLFPVMEALNTKLLLVCSSALPADQLNPSTQTAVDNLRVIRTAAANWSPHPTKVTFEALLWGTHINLWCQAWTIVLAVDMENIGVPLDSLNTLACEWADLTVPGGIQLNADTDLQKSISELSNLLGTKIFLPQMGDGAWVATPLAQVTAEMPALMSWSRSSYFFLMESDRGGYLPMGAIIEAVVMTAYAVPWCLDISNTSQRAPAESTQITAMAFETLALTNSAPFW
ncbi:hypothetical protein PCANC_18594 [Puccinia coronata f. sp. avenae]|uniref:Uncharacterized protein n=1 Tax=Puccinia coronata f. sp. avenae TaxID=200324 RepID=A0A2N5TMJ5_9BASI|nr:hypothetical protein PCANC_18594 [Puccinia coronata f. sp. avenae]